MGKQMKNTFTRSMTMFRIPIKTDLRVPDTFREIVIEKDNMSNYNMQFANYFIY